MSYLSLGKLSGIFILSLFVINMVEAVENITSHFERQIPEKVSNVNKKCPNQFNFENLEVEACQDGTGEMTLYIYAKNDHSEPLLIKKLGDAYYIKPVLFKKTSGLYDTVLVVDHGAEFSYGSMVFYRVNKNIESIGIIDLVLNEGEGSLLSHINLGQDSKSKLIFQFDTDTYLPMKQGEYKKMTKDKVFYEYDKLNGLKLKTR